jgi:hypothetical protein
MKFENLPAMLLALCLAIFAGGCESTRERPRKNSDATQQARSSQRFLPITSLATPGGPPVGSVALDTETGQLCQTYAVPKDGPTWVVSLPRCIDLYKDTDATLALERSRNTLDKEIMDAVNEVKKQEKQK